MATIEQYAAAGVYDPPSYAQAVKVTGAQAILFISGQVAYDERGNPAHPRDFAAQARSVFQAVKEQVEAGGGTLQDIVKINTYLTDIRYRTDLVPSARSSSARGTRPPPSWPWPRSASPNG